VTSDVVPASGADAAMFAPLDLDVEPAGDRYYRHPGDVVRTVLWVAAAVMLGLFIEVTSDTSDGLTTDLGRAGARVSRPARELVLALAQVAAVTGPVVIVVLLLAGRRFRRLGLVVLGALAGAAILTLLDRALDLPGRLPDAVTSGTWLASTRFPNLAYIAGAMAASMLGKPWLGRSWRRAVDVAVCSIAAAMALAGSAGVPELLLAAAVGAATGAVVLVIFGAPNRRPSPAAVAAGLRGAGLDVEALTLERAVGGRSQLYRARTTDRRRVFVKVYAQDSRDADLLYRSYRALVLRAPNDYSPSASLEHDVRHEALLLLLARRAGVNCPELEALTALPDGSMVLAMTDVDGRPLDSIEPGTIGDDLLDSVWREVKAMERGRIAHRSLRAANVLVAGDRPVVIDLGFGDESSTSRLESIDRAELLTSLATLVGADRSVASASRVLDPGALAASAPYIQPLALSASTRKQASKALLRSVREQIASATGEEPEPLERLVRVKPKTVLTIVALAGAFYVLLPQLANVDDSVRALRSASWGWLAVCVVMSMSTYVASVIGLRGSVQDHLPFVPTLEAQVASSFVNRVTPANVGGMALNVRYMQKAGVDPAQAVTAIGLNVAAGGIVHVVLIVVFFAWAGQSSSGISVPSGSKVLIALAVLLAVAGLVVATRRGRRFAERHVVGFARRGWAGAVAVARSPLRLAALLGGSTAVTIAYITALAAASQAFHGGLSFAQVGAVYLGASMIAAAAPTPGGLGALEAAVVAGFTALKMDPGVAVAVVLSYRLATYWLPVLPGWLCFRNLEARNFI
jgi:uncharacterized membrane protein YbhN (UPF0104 family)